MLTSQTLIGIACLIANKGPIDSTTVEAQLDANDRAMVEVIIQSGACLPGNLENLLKATSEKIKNGEIKGLVAGSNPTEVCF